MKPPYEDLSRLRSGDLPEDEAAALRRRIDAEPEVGRAWAELGALVDALSGLRETAPPPSLDARVLGVSAPAPRVRWKWAAAIAAAAAIGHGVLSWESPVDRITLVEGMQWVDGQVELLAGDVPVTIDGMARVTVEPAGPLVRGPDEEAGMKVMTGTALGAAVGVVVTVAVMSGTATVTPANGSPVVLEAGQVQTFRPPGGAAPTVGAAGTDEVAVLKAEVADLREKLAEAQFTGAVARGQVVASQGEPLGWPTELPDAYRPEAFEANLKAEIAKIPGIELHALDCSEYPCIATMTGTGLGEKWQDKMKQIPDSLTSGAYPDSNVWMGIAGMETDAGMTAAAGIALTPPGETRDPAVQTRTDFRAKAMMDELEGSIEER